MKSSLPIMQDLNDFCKMATSNFRALNCNYFVLDRDMNFIDCNLVQAHAMGADNVQEIVSQHATYFLQPQYYEALRKNDRTVIESNQAMFFEEYVAYKEDEAPSLYLTLKFPLYTQARCIGCFGVGMNLSSRKLSVATDLLSAASFLNNLGNKPNQLKRILASSEIDGVYLSNTETMVLYHLVRGKTAKGIAQVLCVSPRTVETHLVNLKNKLHCQTKSDLIERALDSGFYANFFR